MTIAKPDNTLWFIQSNKEIQYIWNDNYKHRIFHRNVNSSISPEHVEKFLEAVYIYQHFHKCTKGTLFLTPSPSIPKVYNKMLIL